MEKMPAFDRILELLAEGLVLTTHREQPDVILVKVYERGVFNLNPNPASNPRQIAQYSTCSSHMPLALAELQEMYTGWSQIDRTQPTQLIGIHNEDPFTLYIQFALGQRYFVYERSLGLDSETVREELFGRKHHLRQRFLNGEDEQYLIARLRFMPKTKKAISYYTRKNVADFVGHDYSAH